MLNQALLKLYQRSQTKEALRNYQKVIKSSFRDATKCLRNGIEIKDVADILGHRRTETTENYYISSTMETRKKANIILENIIQSDVTNKIINFV